MVKKSDPRSAPEAGAPADAAAPGSERPATAPRTTSGSRRVTNRVAAALGGAADAVESAASAVGAAVGATVGATVRRFDERPGARVRRVRRMGHAPLAVLWNVHPDARQRTPRELGVETIDVADIAGTAVGGAQQRGGDFLPLKPFRTANWSARWQRLGNASERLAVLPPIDVLRYDDTYWVSDGHNRVGLALYNGQAGIDADVTELTDPARSRTQPAESFASLVEDSRELRAAVSRTTPGDAKDPTGDPAPRNRPSGGDR